MNPCRVRQQLHTCWPPCRSGRSLIRPRVDLRGARTPTPRAEPPQQTSEQPPKPEAADADEKLTTEEIQKLAALRRQQAARDSNIVQKVVDESREIDWPQPQRAALDTVYVLAIVIGASAFLFALNTLLAETARKMY